MTTQAIRQPRMSVSHCASGGCTATLTENPSMVRLRARPRLRSNHCDARLPAQSISEPCPKNRSAPNPSVSATNPFTAPNATAAVPSAAPTAASTVRTPWRSIIRPTRGSPNAATSVANAYALETEVREMPRSSEIGSRNTLKVCDCPGPLANITSAATASITQP